VFGGRAVVKILVADDNSNIQKMVGLALKDQGIDVVAVGNGEAAVRKISDLHPDLVLADIFMPVRNGYEVCKYVKDDPTLSHIPVILLVGAFDPLDEQEAQRVGADGVLKKPFVPPDPLISMVKSALARAGVKIEAAAKAEKAAEAATRAASELLNPVVSAKLAALSMDKLPDVQSEPLDDFPAPPEQVRIAAGHQPVAFGSLLETPEAEDDAAFLPNKHGRDGDERNWGADEAEEEMEAAEEDSPNGGWRPDVHDAPEDDPDKTRDRVSDWREAAFHGDSPAASLRGARWTPAVEEPSHAEAAHAPAVGVTTLEAKPSDAPAPFSGDAWAAAMAAGVEEKLAEAKEAASVTPEVESHAEAKPAVEDAPAQETHAQETVKVSESARGWYSVTSSPWETEAKKASLLASTWDTPHTEPAAAVEESSTAPVEEPSTPQHETVVEHQEEAPSGAYAAEPPAVEAIVASHSETWKSAEAPIAEIHEEQAAPAAGTKTWENTGETHTHDHSEHFYAPAGESAPHATEEIAVGAHEEPAPAEPVAAPAESAKPDLDALVARVLARMSPDVLQKVTQDILKPVIAAIIQDELNSKKP